MGTLLGEDDGFECAQARGLIAAVARFPVVDSTL
jgi:hypothetical protein